VSQPNESGQSPEREDTRAAADVPEKIVNSLLETREHFRSSPDQRAEPSTDRNDPTPTPLQLTLPPKFTYVRRLGVGGMGEVIHAYDTALKRHVAIKFMRPTAANSVFARRRFLEEANILAQLHHPNVVDVFEKGEIDGQPYFVMAYLDGGTLAERKEEFRTTAGRVVGVIATVAGGVHHAHENGVFHRDLKASNVVFDDGRPVVADFGCARWDDGEISTQGYALLGTPSHMAPEVIERGSKGHDARADLWSLGVMLYHLLSGELPFTTDPRLPGGREKLLRDELTPVRDCPKKVPGVDDALEAIVRKALARNPDDRYQTAAELAAVLGLWLEQVEVSATPTTVTEPAAAARPAQTSPVTGRWFAVLSVVFVVCGMGTAVALWKKSDPASVTPSVVDTRPAPFARTLAERLKNADDSVEFIGQTGLPEGLPPSPAGVIGAVSLSLDKLCEVESARVFLLELGDEPLPFRYRITAQVRLTTTTIDTKVGLYANRAAHPQPGGSIVHAAFVNSYGPMTTAQTVPRFAGKDGWGTFPARIALSNTTFAPTDGEWQPVAQDAAPTDDMPGPFHQIEIEVQPTRWQAARDGQTLKPKLRALAASVTTAAFHVLGETLTPPVFGNGFGLFVFQGGGQFRNVRIVRLPN
jgi:hypothetical protein